jgi:hypothetical protein
VPHEMPAGALMTLPVPSPARTIASVTRAGAKVALTVVAVVSGSGTATSTPAGIDCGSSDSGPGREGWGAAG